MRFFIVVFATLFFIAVFDLIDVAVQFCLLPKVYVCSEITKDDPISVQRRCHK